MHSEIKTIRWVSSKSRALKAVSQDLKTTFTHMEQIISTSNRADELGQAKAILNDLKQVKFIKYLYLMMDILSAITATSTLFQTKDLLVFEVKEAIDTLFTKLHGKTIDPGENLSKFYSVFDNESRLFDGYLKLLGTLNDFAEDRDIHSLLEKMGQYILDRFADLDKSPVSDMRVFDFRLWPPTLSELSTYGNSEIKSLCQYYNDVLTEDEVKLAPDQWQTLKVQVSMQRKYHPLAVYSSILQRQEESLMHISTLLSLLFTVSPSTASCERVFSRMNLIKTSLRTRLTQENLQNQMRIVVNGSSFQEFDPDPSVMQWLKSANRHITHKKPVKVKQPDPTEEPSTSQSDPASAEAEADMNIVQPMLDEMVKLFGGEDAARQKLKSLSEKEQGSCALM